ncbi:MAG TPA: PLP-dependent aminotransferase family protein [Candidatus Krumholzibacteria bacterium]|nr:PLP-dependent aminotransferase family protein [Candidatus Krumholzibacteria bacterium]HPD72220.1 PLP-dependent aminotransferase family protein [Candidatus Krumholzibacteria bacterium]HRY40848.1 PLP-dependent aminotransferase family protein [Candidatus Krumholzibacteria bacterium]
MTIWRPEISERPGPRYKSIADAIGDDVSLGKLRPGDQLPTQRDLAEYLDLTLGTVTRAYKEAERRGLIQGEVGRGTFVCAERDHHDPLLEPGREPAGMIDLGLNLPLYAEDPDLAGALRGLSKRRDLAGLLSYQPFTGNERYRRAGVEWIGRHGLAVEPEQIVITGGAQHAITVALSALCRAGDLVLTEALTYPGLKTAAKLLGVEVAPVAMDGEGILPAALDRAAQETGARVVYCMPTLHNPTTATMSRARRDAVAEVVARRQLQVIEDDVHGLLAAEPEPPLAGLVPERALYIASTSKVLAGGLRVAFVAAPPALVERLAFAVAASLWALPALSVEVATLWIADGTAAAVTGRKRSEAAARQELARRVLPEARFRRTERSYFLWLELPEPWRSDRFARAARDLGVVVSPAEAFAAGRTPPPPAVRVSLSSPAGRGELEHGLRTLAGMLERGPAPEPAIV